VRPLLRALAAHGVTAADRWQQRRLPASVREPARELLRGAYGKAFPSAPGLFEAVQIQTVAACNLSCPFCPANRSQALYGGVGPHVTVSMADDVFERIVEQLGALRFAGTVQLFLMNEPTLDPKLAERVARVRAACPRCTIRVSTNGVLLDQAGTQALFDAGLDELAVNDYSGDGRVIAKLGGWALRTGAGWLAAQDRDVTEPYDPLGYRLYNRSGHSERASHPTRPSGFCDRPFRFLYIGYTGEAVLCCSDWDFEEVLGDVREQTLEAIWSGDRYRRVRERLRAGSREEGLCSRCDFSGVSHFKPGRWGRRLLAVRRRLGR